MHLLEISGISFADIEAFNVRQTYEPVPGATSQRRMADQSLSTQCFGTEKLRTVITGQSWVPPGFAGLDRRTDYTVKCLGTRTVSSSTNSVTIPTRRTDVDVEYTATVGGELVSWDGSSVVASAQAYRGTYVPQIDTARLVEAVTDEGDLDGNAVWNWRLVFEET